MSDLDVAIFPPAFAWGAATASYQVEGAVAEDGRGESIWDRFTHTPARVVNGDTGDVACDHYHRWREDVALMAALGLTAYRFSIAWPRVQPDGAGPINDRGLDFYDRLVDELLAHGIRPVVTLYHWDLPQALQDRGGWASADIVEWFGVYADAVATRLADRVTDWITLNEPQVFAFVGHVDGRHAPGLTDPGAGLAAAHHAHLAHRAASDVLRGRRRPDARIGIALSLWPAVPASDDPADAAAAHRLDGASNRWFLDPVFGRPYPSELVDRYAPLLAGLDLGAVVDTPEPDFLGVNYYSRHTVVHDDGVPYLSARMVEPPAPRTAMGWEIHPSSLRDLLLRLHRDYAPRSIVITENGAAFEDHPDGRGFVRDDDRIAYLETHLAAVAEARAAGVPVDGYLLWSLLDNFEWAEGYAKRFGIVRVDFETQARTPKASARWYADLIARAPRP